MTDASMAPETPDVAETVNFLRRFADLMSTGYNAAYLHRAAELLETLTARVAAVSDEEELWRYKYETVNHHVDLLESECDALKNDIEGHLNITSSTMAERDALKAALQGRDAELAELDAALNRERGDLAAKLAAHEQVMSELRLAFDRERELRLALDRERDELKAKLTVRDDELAALRVVTRRETDALVAKVAALEAKRAELRSAFDRIGDLRNQTAGDQGTAGQSFPRKPGPEAEAAAPPAQPGDRDAAVGDSNAVVPKTTLRQARAQFEYLAREFIPLGDIASQVMCELGAYTMDLALVTGQQTDRIPVDEVALSILATPDSDLSGLRRQDAGTIASSDLGSAR
jgi:hypothetical protein